MTIACTRCGATCEGDIIVPPLAFGFKHNKGCGHGVGPLAVLPGSYKPKTTKVTPEPKQKEKPEFLETKPVEEIKAEEKVEEPKQENKKRSRFSKKE
jgi:hypothetical protein